MRHPDTGYRVAVIGAGWAGCAAAVQLAGAGIQTTLYEQAAEPGGRARTVVTDGLRLDNGQHLLLGAYEGTLSLIARVHARSAETVLDALPLTLAPFGRQHTVRFRAAPGVPAPWHLLLGVLGARGLSVADRRILVRTMRRLHDPAAAGDDRSVADCFGSSRRVYASIWAPLCLAALNTPPERASARVFANVLRAAFHGSASASRFLLPKGSLGEVFPTAATRYIARHGGTVHCATRVRSVDVGPRGVAVLAAFGSNRFDAVIVAVAPHQVGNLVVTGAGADWLRAQALAASLRHESINTVHLGYTEIGMRHRVERLDDAPGQWIFDNGHVTVGGDGLRHVSVVISGSGAHDGMLQPALAASVDAQLRRLAPQVGSLRYARVIAERRATYACAPSLPRPRCGRISTRLHLAGDFTHPDYPATLEAAVQSGLAAAASVLDERATGLAGAAAPRVPAGAAPR